MATFDIPYAESVFIDRTTEPLREILVVVTQLPEPSPAGSGANAREELLKAVALNLYQRRLNGHRIVWSGGSVGQRP